MSIQSMPCSDKRVELAGILAEFRDALEEEIDRIKKSGQSSTLLCFGRRVENHGAEFWYRFNVEYAPSLPADTPCKLIIGKDQFDVTVISFEENSIIISSKNPLPDTIGVARLENGATVLMERLIKCIEENAEIENAAGKRMLALDVKGRTFKKLFSYQDIALDEKNTDSQNKAIVSALTNDITYIWGPPGTGKTTVIGQIIVQLYQHDRTVLVVSHTNTAVDGAIEKADKIYSEMHQGDEASYPILRVGVPARPLPERVLLSSHVAELGKELYAQKAELENRQSELRHRNNKIIPLLDKDKWVEETKLPEVQKLIQELLEQEKEVQAIQYEINAVNKSVMQEKTAHPEYSQYLVLARSYKGKQAEYESVCTALSKAAESVNVLPANIQNALDEIKKHAIYAELRERESKYMSVQFIRAELSKIGSKITSLRTEISDLEAKQQNDRKVIDDYERKSSVAKLFAGKAAVTQAQDSLRVIADRLPGADEMLRCQKKLEQKYKGQLEQLLLLQEQIKTVVPSKTREYWEALSEQLKDQLSDAMQMLPLLSSRKETLRTELDELDGRKNLSKVSFDALGELGRKLRQLQNDLSKVNEKIKATNGFCAELIEQELTLCATFFSAPSGNVNRELFEEMSSLLSSVKDELAAVDMSALYREKKQADAELIEIFRRLNELKDKMQELEKQAITKAKIVGATLAKSYLSKELRERRFDTVILDEASMASIPALWCAGYLAERNIVIVGDFLQLPPIVIAETPMAKKWLGKDIFYHSGMQERAKGKAACPENFVMLNDQFRMESDIADIANMYYGEYGGLRSNDASRERERERKIFYEWYSGKRTEPNISLIDTESLHAWVTGVSQGKGHSRLNCFSAAVDVDLAFKLLENKLNALDPESAQPEKEATILIVAPYKPHVARVNRLIDLEYRNRAFKENLNYIRAGTIHSFQGSEADIVIFDLVIDEPHWKANLFMTDKEVNEDLRKMFNVAVTRAKFKLYVVGNFAYCQKRAKNNALSELLDKLLKKDGLEKVDAKELLPNIAFARQNKISVNGKLTGKHIVCREESFNDYFMKDILSFKRRMIIYSPFVTEQRLSILLPSFVDAIAAGKQIIVVTKALSDRSKVERHQYQKCEMELRDIGVSVIHKKGMHEKLIFIDDTAVWIGSLNALSFTGLTGEVMQRHADKELTAEYEKLFNIEHICGAIENRYEQKCPICGKEMIVKESAEGGIYWECIEGDYSRNISQQYPVDGILRCKCGAPYVFAMKNEPRWICSENPKHYQKMRESDLKLEKMAALIPTRKARKEVDRFFAQRKKAKATAPSKTNGDSKKSAAAKPSAASDDGEQMRLF